MDYETVIKSIIEKQKETIGMIAVQRAKKLDVLEFDGNEVQFNGEPTKEDLEDLMDEYKEIQGKGAVGIARKAMSGTLDGDRDIDLPEEIIPKDLEE